MILHQSRGNRRLHLARALRLLALLGLFLLPIQMRAGTTYVHPHALLHLLLDAADNGIDHHHPATTPPDHAHGGQGKSSRGTATASPDLPTFESIQMAAGGLAVTLVALVLLLFTARQERVWPRREAWRDRRVLPELPPPRRCALSVLSAINSITA
jgi:hypothetical protein